MTIGEALSGVTRLFLDTALVIYYVEQHPEYLEKVSFVFERLDAGNLIAVTSPITLAESLILPDRTNNKQLRQDFLDLLVYGASTEFARIGEQASVKAAALRAQYNLSLLDALQLAVAIIANCEAFLTNDLQLRCVTEIQVLALQALD